jgi:transcriptional regulator with XRE-family HTH domain
MTPFGERLRAVRKAAGLSQAKLARRCGMDTIRISQIERGCKDPRLQTLLKLADGLGCKLDDFRPAAGQVEATAEALAREETTEPVREPAPV